MRTRDRLHAKMQASKCRHRKKDLELENLKKLSFLIVPFAIAGCGGGSGGPGGPGGPNFTSFSEIKADEATTIKGEGRESIATLTSDGDADLTEFERASTSADVETDSEGNITSISLKTPSSTKTLNQENTSQKYSTTLADGKFISLVSEDEMTNITFAEPTANGFEYQTFGTWREAASEYEGSIGTTSLGADTSVASIPISGKATFQGTAMGEYVDLDPDENIREWHLMTSEATLEADFAGRSAEFQTANTKAAGGESRNDLNLNGTMSYSAGSNEMSGSVRTAGGMAGDIDGRFYGPNAQEVGGTFTVKGDGVEQYYGGYGAKKQ